MGQIRQCRLVATKFIISYLYEDDYDPDGYPSILSHLKSSGVEVYGKGSHGRHTDNSANVMAWFKSQYNNLLHDDFQDKQINVAGHTVRCEQ